MAEYSQEFLEKTVEVWQAHSHAPISQEDAREIADNMVHLVSLLSELLHKYGKAEEKT